VSVHCPVCEAEGGSVRVGRGGVRLRACPSCRCLFLDPEAHPYVPEAIYDQAYFEPWDMRPGSPSWALRVETAAARVALLARLGARGRLLDVGCAGGYLVAEATRQGFDAFGVELSAHAVAVAAEVAPGRVRQGVPEAADYQPGSFGALTAFDVVEHHPSPRELLARVRELLAPGGLFAATVPDLSSLTGRLMGAAWPHLKEEHRFYPTRPAFRDLLRRSGLVPVHEEAARKRLSLAYLAPLFEAYPVPVLTPLASLAGRVAPRPLREARFTVTIGERLYVARREG
jgi:SAM-dependent methyltransferase